MAGYCVIRLPKRLRRLKTIHTMRDRPLFFVTFCTESRQTILANKLIQDAFVSFCKQSPEKININVGKYVIMPDHIHVFVSAEGSQTLSKWVGGLKRHLAWVLKDYRASGPQNKKLWQKGFFDHLMRSRESYSEKWAYVEQNPVRAGLVQQATKWPFMGEVFPLRFD